MLIFKKISDDVGYWERMIIDKTINSGYNGFLDDLFAFFYLPVNIKEDGSDC